jgi:hypothetical protein
MGLTVPNFVVFPYSVLRVPYSVFYEIRNTQYQFKFPENYLNTFV